MKHPIIITSSGKVACRKRQKVRISLPYSTIPRRVLIQGLDVPLIYDRSIDISAIK